MDIVERFLSPWYEALEDVPTQQHDKMLELLEIYEETELGRRSNAGAIETYEKFREFLPVSTFNSLAPYYNSVFSGDYRVLLAEEPRAWVLSRDKSKGTQRYFPITEADLRARIAAWPRALLNYIHKTNRYDILNGFVLNLSYPSNVKLIQVGNEKVPSGYASGITTKFGASYFGFKLTPNQDELDGFPANLDKRSLESRFQFIIDNSKALPVTAIKGNLDLILKFGKYFTRRYGKPPKQFWKTSALMCHGTAGIHAKHKLSLRSIYGDCTVIESYEAAEGSFGQQIDEEPFIVPNYDLYFFEVDMPYGQIPLYSMRAGDTGSLIVSSASLPRLKIGDMIRCMAPNKFVLIGSGKALDLMKYDIFTSGSELETQRDVW